MKRVDFYFDVISPYSWLALRRAPELAEREGIEWRYEPVVYGVILDRTGLVGPAETAAKRRYTFLDVARQAARAGIPLVGPPAHPFRSLEALRTIRLFRDRPEVGRLARSIADAAWAEGLDVTDVTVLAARVRGVGLPADGLAERIRAEAVKRDLAEATERALAAGVFGVPSFLLDGEIFWGHDRLEDLVGRVRGTLAPLPPEIERMLARPRAVDRRRRP